MRLISTSFLHVLFLKINIEGNVKSATERKFSGIYYHNLIRHSCEQYQVFSGRSANTEKEEATFNTLKTFSILTSNHHPQNVIFNSLVRLQAKEILAAGENEYDKNEIFSSSYQPIKSSFSNTLILLNWIKTYPSSYQVMSEQLVNFLIADKKCWEETKNGVLFFDLDIRGTDIKLHHFRSSSIVSVSRRYLLDCWNKYVLNSDSLIPAHKIKIYN